MSKPVFFAFYPKDFAADEKVEAMTTEQVGAYILLLCKAWQADPPASLPNDDQTLAKYSRLSAVKWAELKAGVLSPFVLGLDNRWHQKRLRSEFEKSKRLKRARSNAGSAGALVRWQTHSKGMANALQNDGNLSGSVSGSESGSGCSPDRGGGAGEGCAPRFDLTPEGLAQRWAWSYRGSVGSHRDTYAIARDFAEFLRTNPVTPEQMAAAIDDLNRDRTEAPWAFKARLVPKAKQQPQRESKRYRGP